MGLLILRGRWGIREIDDKISSLYLLNWYNELFLSSGDNYKLSEFKIECRAAILL